MDKISFDESRYLIPEESPYISMLSYQKIMEMVMTHILTARQREVITYYYMQNKKIPEIARILGVHKSTVSRTIARGMQKVRKHLYYFSDSAGR